MSRISVSSTPRDAAGAAGDRPGEVDDHGPGLVEPAVVDVRRDGRVDARDADLRADLARPRVQVDDRRARAVPVAGAGHLLDALEVGEQPVAVVGEAGTAAPIVARQAAAVTTAHRRERRPTVAALVTVIMVSSLPWGPAGSPGAHPASTLARPRCRRRADSVRYVALTDRLHARAPEQGLRLDAVLGDGAGRWRSTGARRVRPAAAHAEPARAAAPGVGPAVVIEVVPYSQSTAPS